MVSIYLSICIGAATQVYSVLLITHLVLILTTDYGAPMPFLNKQIFPAIFMGMFDFFMIGCFIFLPYLIDGFHKDTAVIFQALGVFGAPLQVLLDYYPYQDQSSVSTNSKKS